jgi:hypothetical protein
MPRSSTDALESLMISDLQRLYALHFQRQLATRARAVIEMKSGIELGRVGGPRCSLDRGLSIPKAFNSMRRARDRWQRRRHGGTP